MEIIDIESLAQLSKIKLSEQDMDLYIKDMQALKQFADDLSELEPEALPDYSVMAASSVMRPDTAVTVFDREPLLKNAPELSKSGNMVSVPKVL